ncbi:TetR/AcrR family transcriptional regulator [Brevibacterium album]|uniref:TetR/AcrR family transcriptional regulator n=1 Tax=Brevibacterium album TaxID=417948 RepID=UPI001FE17B4D|nr:TetR/AcrR family transcriptional regulator [Brevibacterium album]
MATESQSSAAALGLRNRVKACISESGAPQREFSRRVDLDETKLSKSLRGVRRFKPDELVRIATVAGVTVNWLLTGSDSSAGTTAVPLPSSLPRRVRDTPDHVQKRREIIEAAWRLFADRGLHRTRIADIARACGVSSSAVHYHFQDKQELFEECLRFSVKLAFDCQVATLHLAAGPLERLRHLMALQLPDDEGLRADWSIWLQSWNSVAVEGGSRENHTQAYRRWYRTVYDVIAEGQDSGIFADAPTEDLATQLTSLFDGLGIKVLVGTVTPERMRAQVDSFIDRVLLAHT